MALRVASAKRASPAPNVSIATTWNVKMMAFAGEINLEMHDANAPKTSRAFDVRIAHVKVSAVAMDSVHFIRARHNVTVMLATGVDNANQKNVLDIAKMAAHAQSHQRMTKIANAHRTIRGNDVKMNWDRIRSIVIEFHAKMVALARLSKVTHFAIAPHNLRDRNVR